MVRAPTRKAASHQTMSRKTELAEVDYFLQRSE
jgi:hypothetical protein